MARKTYSEQDREQIRIALMSTTLRCIADRGLIHSSIDILCKEVGISKTFFYTFFPSKEELVLEALRYQQPRLLEYARQLMEDPSLGWREGVRTFLESCVYGDEKRELQFFPLRKNRKFTAVSRRRISRSFVKIKQIYSVTCLGFSACLRTVWIPDCSAIWPCP